MSTDAWDIFRYDNKFEVYTYLPEFNVKEM